MRGDRMFFGGGLWLTAALLGASVFLYALASFFSPVARLTAAQIVDGAPATDASHDLMAYELLFWARSPFRYAYSPVFLSLSDGPVPASNPTVRLEWANNTQDTYDWLHTWATIVFVPQVFVWVFVLVLSWQVARLKWATTIAILYLGLAFGVILDTGVNMLLRLKVQLFLLGGLCMVAAVLAVTSAPVGGEAGAGRAAGSAAMAANDGGSMYLPVIHKPVAALAEQVTVRTIDLPGDFGRLFLVDGLAKRFWLRSNQLQ